MGTCSLLFEESIRKEVLKQGGKAGPLPSCLLAIVQETIPGQRKEFRHRLQVPIRLIEMDLPEVGGQLRKLSFHVESLSIPSDQRTSGKIGDACLCFRHSG